MNALIKYTDLVRMDLVPQPSLYFSEHAAKPYPYGPRRVDLKTVKAWLKEEQKN